MSQTNPEEKKRKKKATYSNVNIMGGKAVVIRPSLGKKKKKKNMLFDPRD